MSKLIGEKSSFILLIFFLALYILTANGRVASGDGEVMYQVTRSLVDKFTIEVPALAAAPFEVADHPYTQEKVIGHGAIGRGGKYYSLTGIGESLLAVPFYLMGRAVHSVLPSLNVHYLTRFAVSLLNPSLTALICVLVFVFARGLGFSGTLSLGLAFIYGLGTMAWPYAKTTFSEPGATLFILAAVYAAFRFRQTDQEKEQRNWLLLVNGMLGLAVLTRMTSLIVVPAIYLYLVAAWREKERNGYALLKKLLLPAILLVGAIVLFLAYNWLRFGSIFDTGYRGSKWETPLLVGLYGLLLSPGKGLFLYTPLSLLAIVAFPRFYESHKLEALLFLLVVIIYLFFHAPFTFWEGGLCWGPRFLLPALPFLVLPLASLWTRQERWVEPAVALLLAVGILIQLSVVVLDPTRYYQAVYLDAPDRFYHRTIFEPAFSPLVGQWRSIVEVGGLIRNPAAIAALKGALGAGRPPAEVSEDEINRQAMDEVSVLALNVPDFWFVYFYILGFNRPAIAWALLVNVLLVCITGYLLLKSREYSEIR